MVRALQRLAASAALGDLVTAMPADVDERAELTVATVHDDDRHVANPAGEERSRLGHLRSDTGVLPGAAEDSLVLEPQDVGVGIPRRGQGQLPLEVSQHAWIRHGDHHRERTSAASSRPHAVPWN